ncbi:MAG TPA: hypothetical protein VJ810_02655 [Blastocatellia bacterium]|nr:hypothetical protein [Blastocatellia bacterium]
MLRSKKVHHHDCFSSIVWKNIGLRRGLYCITIFLLLATICVSPGAAQTVDRAKLLEEIIALQEQIKNTTDPEQKATLQEQLERKEELYLAPSAEDLSAHAEFLLRPDTGLLRLLPRESFDLNNQKLSLRGGGCFFSFTRMTHEYGFGSDLTLELGRFAVGFAGTHFGFLVSLGDATLETLTVDHPGLRYLAAFAPPTNEPGAREQQQRARQGFTENDFLYIDHITATVGSTFAVRSVYQERSDVLVAFRVLRQDTDGSLILLWKRLKWFATPQLRTDGFLATVSAASYGRAMLAPGAIATVFGLNLSPGVEAAPSIPLPTSLSGVSISVQDKSRVYRAPLFVVTPNQLNFQIPEETLPGPILLSINNSQSGQRFGETTHVTKVAPAIFTANADGLGAPAGLALRVSGVAQSYEAIVRYDASQMKFVPQPINLGPANETVFLVVFGSGIRGRRSLPDVKVTIDGVPVEVTFAGPVPGLVALDQINFIIPRILAGRGNVEVVITIDGRVANTFIINIQ